MKNPRIKPITDDFTARIFMVNGHQVIYKKNGERYEFMGVLAPIALVKTNLPEEKGKVKAIEVTESKGR